MENYDFVRDMIINIRLGVSEHVLIWLFFYGYTPSKFMAHGYGIL